ncbi:MAG: DCC1-like thiol-disulfide oxidoreductase family protein [Actinomycetes bacterium]
MPDQQPISVLYDADCDFCRWSVSKLLEKDSHGLLLPVSIQSARGQSLLSPIAQERRLDSAHCVASNGEIRSGGQAVEWIAMRTEGAALAGRLAAAAPWIFVGGYRLVAKNRGLFSRWMTPSRLALADRVIAQREGPPESDTASLLT